MSVRTRKTSAFIVALLVAVLAAVLFSSAFDRPTGPAGELPSNGSVRMIVMAVAGGVAYVATLSWLGSRKTDSTDDGQATQSKEVGE